jgi:rRNA processing protein Gar1
LGLILPQAPIKIGKCSIKTQGKILVQLEDEKLPKIKSLAKVKRKGHFKKIGEVIEVIGSTRKPWIVISASQNSFNLVKLEENIFTEERFQRRKKKDKKKDRRKKKNRS